jgi:hypothetical protein
MQSSKPLNDELSGTSRNKSVLCDVSRLAEP